MERYNKKVLFNIFSVVFIFLLSNSLVYSHCEIPCGIYGDKAQVKAIHQHIETISKSIKMIKLLSTQKEKNYNQLIRWIMNKEEHAKKIQEIVHQYFMTQRIKPKDASNKHEYKKYIQKLTLLHKMLIYAMKTKQNIDFKYTKKLHDTLVEFSKIYFSK